MPMDRSKYPDNWEIISWNVRESQGWKCKFCGVRGGDIGYRDSTGTFHRLYNITDTDDEILRVSERSGLLHDAVEVKLIKIVLTTAHLNHDTEDNREENLVALCQRCHNRYDRPHRNRNSAITRRRKKLEAGQAELL